MSYRGSKNWPPTWTNARNNDVKTIKGEIGVLVYVHSHAELSTRMYLVMDHDGKTYVGTLIFENNTFCKQIGNLLRLHLKRPIKDIGDLDLSHFL